MIDYNIYSLYKWITEIGTEVFVRGWVCEYLPEEKQMVWFTWIIVE